MKREQRDRLEELLTSAVINALESTEEPPSAATLKLALDLLVATDRGTIKPKPTPEEARQSMLDSPARQGKTLPFPLAEEKPKREPPALLRED